MAIVKEERIGGQRLILRDCLEVMPLLESVDAVVTDPPYGIGERKGTISKSRNRNAYQSYDDSEQNIIEHVVPAFKVALKMSDRAIVTPGGKCAWHYPKPVDIGIFYQLLDRADFDGNCRSARLIRKAAPVA